MAKSIIRYQKNFGLLIAFLVVVTALFVIAAWLARSTVANHVESEFYNRKVDVFDESIKAFNDFLYHGIPEVSYYQGFLDSAQARQFANNILRKNPFVEKVVFFDVSVTNSQAMLGGVRSRGLLFHPKSVISFHLDAQNRMVPKSLTYEENVPFRNDFNNMGVKIFSYLDNVNEATTLTEEEIYRVFYNLSPGKITYLNIPRVNDLMVYKTLQANEELPESFFDQDMFVFQINPQKIRIVNTQPRYYEHISVVPLTDPNVMTEQAYVSTELPLPGALSDFKLKFDSSQEFMSKEINRWFFPVVLAISALYLIILSIVYLIYRSMVNNSRLYRLQYDFINNLTHEFKTPVSVIKIAGNNIKSAGKVSDQERQMYGKILDQEADKLNSLMNRLLSFAQIENKSIKFKGEWIDLHQFCKEFFSALQIKYPDMDIRYEVKATQEMYADPILLTAVFQNLVDNAYKYSNPVRRSVAVDIQQTRKNIVIVFKDKGIGIAKSELKNVFKKFYRVKNQFNQGGSIGLGLSFCKEITVFMGGEIKVESTVGEGTTFTLTFPR